MKQRERRLAAEPLCRDCKAEGRVTLATEVHHEIPLAAGGPDTDDNVMSLCHDHHQLRTAQGG